jgi:hypothetical protein
VRYVVVLEVVERPCVDVVARVVWEVEVLVVVT